MTRESLRLRVARWLEPSVGQTPPAREQVPPPDPRPVTAQPLNAWPGICDHFALQLLGLAEELRPSMDSLEGDEEDPDRLRLLYEVDHAVTRMRRAARDMRILAGREDGQTSGHTSSLVDVLRAAESSIERYNQVSIGKMVELAVVAYAADDVASLLAALLDNATRYSPSAVTVSAHLLDNGGVMLRVEDSGIGIAPEHLTVLNAALAGPVPEIDERTGKHTGFPLVHRLARKHGIGVRVACRTPSGSNTAGGTIVIVAIPPNLLCEIPEKAPPIGREAGPGPAPQPVSFGTSEADASVQGRDEPAPLTVSRGAAPPASPGALPRRERTSLRGVDAKSTPVSGRATAPAPATARRSFAEDVSAFTTAGEAAGGTGGMAGGPPGIPADNAAGVVDTAGAVDAADGQGAEWRDTRRPGEDGTADPEEQVR